MVFVEGYWESSMQVALESWILGHEVGSRSGSAMSSITESCNKVLERTYEIDSLLVA